MSTRPPDHPGPDGIERAYRDATALTHDDRRPAASVRANVLEAAAQLAADRAGVGRVAAVGRDAPAANRPSWRLRAGGAAFAALLVAVAGWRLSPQSAGPEPVRVASADVQASGRATIADIPAAQSPSAEPTPPETAARPSARMAKSAPTRAERPVARTSMARRADPVVAAADTDARTAIEAVPSPAAPAAIAAAAPQEAAGRRTMAVTGNSLARASGGAMAYAALQAAPAAPRAALPMPLHAAADRGDLQTLARLVAEPGIAIDAPDAEGRTALLHAVLAQQPGAVRLLLGAGADPDVADRAGLSARSAAQAGASREIATLLAGGAR